LFLLYSSLYLRERVAYVTIDPLIDDCMSGLRITKQTENSEIIVSSVADGVKLGSLVSQRARRRFTTSNNFMNELGPGS